jgi:glycosyltransferase involved in cell wall biosynthesis
VRTLQIYSGNLYGGVEKTLTMIARHGAARGTRREFALCFDGVLRRELLASGARVHSLGAARVRRPWTVGRARKALRSLLIGERFDVAICHSAWAQAIFGQVALRSGTPLVFWLHDAITGRHWLERWAARTRPELVVCNSRFTARAASSLYPGVRTEVIHPPLVTTLDGAGRTGRSELRRGLGATEDEVVIVQPSRLESLKGHDLHLEALGGLRDIAPSWRCWMLGGVQRPHEAAYLRRLRRQAESLGIAERVQFLGQRSDVPTLLRAADVLCQPNTRPDAFGLAFVEGLAAGVPVVTSAFGGALEIVDDTCGCLVPANDAAALSEVLRRLITDGRLREKLGSAGPARAMQLCGADAQMQRLDAVLASAIRGQAA